MMPLTRQTRNESRRLRRAWAFVACAGALLLLVGCKSDKGSTGDGSGVSRGKDPLIAGPGNLIPKQNVPLPDRATGGKTRPDPLTKPTGDKVGYTDDGRFKGTVILGKGNTPAALAGRAKDGDELKIDDGGGVPLTPAGGVLPGGAFEPPADVTPLYAELDKRGVKREDRSLLKENGQWVFRASVARNADGAKTQYTGMADTAADAVKQVLKQLN